MATQNPSRLVFATYLPGMAAYGKEAVDFREEIREAKEYGFDGFAINVPGWSDMWRTRTQNIFEARAARGPVLQVVLDARLRR